MKEVGPLTFAWMVFYVRRMNRPGWHPTGGEPSVWMRHYKECAPWQRAYFRAIETDLL